MSKKSVPPCAGPVAPTLIQLNGRVLTLDAANDLAVKEYNRGNAQGAADIYARMIAVVSDNAFAYNNRGVILHALGRLEDALVSYDKAVAIKPDYAEAHSNRAVILELLQRYDEALASCDRALALVPAYAEAHYNRGVVLQATGRWDEALASYDRAIALKPNYADAYGNRAIVLQTFKRFDEALASYDQAIAAGADRPEVHHNRSSVLQILHRFDEALASCDRAIALKPDCSEAYISRGVILASKGAMPEAEKMFRTALALRPDFPDALFELIKLRKYRNADDDDLKSVRRVLEKPGISSRDREYLLFSLGKIYDECGRFDDAFDSYRQANEIINACVSYDAERVDRTTHSIIEVFGAELLSRPFPYASDSRAPLFIVGMPRSGTTLLASILSNHRSIGTAGELPTIIQFTSQLSEMVGGGVPYPQAARHISAPVAQRLVSDYLQRLRRDIAPDILHVVDKHPINFRHLGLITMLFPGAQIIHCTRDPLDTCLSIYFQRFAPDYDFAFDLRNIGHYFQEYRRLMEHWRRVLPKKMIEVSYEEMITDTAQAARSVLDVLGLDWDERCLTPHTNPYAVETASKWQVRQPIYRHSIERWKHYEKHLGPLIEILPDDERDG